MTAETEGPETTGAGPALLCLNAGSSSLKFGLYPVAGGGPLLRGAVEDTGGRPCLRLAGAGAAARRWDGPQPFGALLEAVLALCDEALEGRPLAAAGHRVVHGGADHRAAEPVTPALLDALERLVDLAPLHEPLNIAPIRALAALRPELPQVACFDTAFHASMPGVATRFGLPRALHDRGIRRYGFHGLSYDHLARRLASDDPALAAGRVIAAHLGSGASLCALRAGRSVETTMGFTATDGLLMGTRCGSLDPGVVLHLERREGMSPAEVDDLLNRRSGLLGVSGISADMAALLASPAPEAAEAVALFVYRALREAGALAACLGGLDGLVFTAGIGERAAPVRAAICDGLAWLGVELDAEANARHAPVISRPGSRVRVRVIAADEEATIARQTRAVLVG